MKLNICFFKINDPPTNSQTPKCWSQGFRRYPAPCLAGSMLVGVRIINDNHPMYTQRSMNHWSPITLLIRFVIPMIHQCPFVTHVRSPQKHTKNWSTGTHEPRPFQEDLRFLRGFPIFCHQNISVWDIFIYFPKVSESLWVSSRGKGERTRVEGRGGLFGALAHWSHGGFFKVGESVSTGSKW